MEAIVPLQTVAALAPEEVGINKATATSADGIASLTTSFVGSPLPTDRTPADVSLRSSLRGCYDDAQGRASPLTGVVGVGQLDSEPRQRVTGLGGRRAASADLLEFLRCLCVRIDQRQAG